MQFKNKLAILFIFLNISSLVICMESYFGAGYRSQNKSYELFTAALSGDSNEVIKLIQDKSLSYKFNSYDKEHILGVVARKCNLEAVKTLWDLIIKGDDPRCLVTGLFSAAEGGNIEVIEFFLSQGADINYKDLGRTAFMIAVEDGQPDVVEYLLSKGARPDTVGSHGETALMYAVWGHNRFKQRQNMDRVLKILLSHNVEVNALDFRGNTAFMIAVRFNNFEYANILLDHGANINACNRYGETALSSAAHSQLSDMVRFLLAKNAAIPDDISRYSPEIQEIIINASYGIIELSDSLKQMCIVEEDAKETATETDPDKNLITAIGRADLAQVDNLLGQGANPNAVNKFGQPILMLAIAKGNAEVTRALLRAGAEVNIANRDQETPLLAALARGGKTGYEDLVMSLLDFDVNINCVDKNECTALMRAVGKCSVQTVEALLYRGADPSRINLKGETALTLAVQKSNDRMVKVLLATGIDPNIIDFEGTPLIVAAAKEGNEEIIKDLLNAGAEIDMVNSSCQSALMVAASKRNVDLVFALLARGAKLPDQEDMLLYIPEIRVIFESIIESRAGYAGAADGAGAAGAGAGAGAEGAGGGFYEYASGF